MFSRNISDSMTKYPYIANKKMTVSEADRFMMECQIRHLPVLEKDKIVGIVSDRDLKKAGSFRGPGELLVEDVMTQNPYCIRKGTSITKVARHLATERIGSAIVVDEKNQIVGIFTTTDGMRLLAEILESGGQRSSRRPEHTFESFPEYMSW